MDLFLWTGIGLNVVATVMFAAIVFKARLDWNKFRSVEDDIDLYQRRAMWATIAAVIMFCGIVCLITHFSLLAL
jgi:hypothetical protein